MARKALTRQTALKRFNTARYNLLIMLIFTLANIVLLFTPMEMMMLFSATVPYYAMIFGIVGESTGLLICMIILAVCVLVAYLLCWIFSKKHIGWLIVALVMFVLDTITLILLSLLLQDPSGILDFLFHGLILYYLISGTICGFKLRNMPAEPDIVGNSEIAVQNATPTETFTDKT